jgi:hypothetical protein
MINITYIIDLMNITQNVSAYSPFYHKSRLERPVLAIASEALSPN